MPTHTCCLLATRIFGRDNIIISVVLICVVVIIGVVNFVAIVVAAAVFRQTIFWPPLLFLSRCY